MRRTLALNLLAGRSTSDVGQGLLALLVTFAFWESSSRDATTGWLLAFLASTLARWFHRRRVVARLADPGDMVQRLRVDVWISASLWGVGGPLLIGGTETELTLLLLVYAGLIAAATSTLVADQDAFYGFSALLLLPMLVTVALGGLTRHETSLLLMILLFGPFMVLVHSRAHRVLVDQVASRVRYHMSEERAARRTEFLNALIEAAPNPILVLSDDHHILNANSAFERVTGYRSTDTIGRPVAQFLQASESTVTLDAFLSQIGEGVRAASQLRVRRRDDELIWLRVSGTTAAKAGVGASILIGEDVTAEVGTREALEAARAAAEDSAKAKSSFLASMSHEIRTPMNGVMGTIELLLGTQLDEQQRDWVEILRLSADSLLSILNDILDVSKIEAGQLSLENVDFDLPQLVTECVRTFTHAAAAKRTELLLDFGEEVPRFVEGDPARIRQVLTNLLSNAIKFTKEGEVVLLVESTPGAPGTECVVFRVRDTGIGIASGKQRMIFEEFSQADASTTRTHGGTGLGLAICKRLVSMMGGTLRVESEVGRGSEFAFMLSMRVAEAPPVRRNAPTSSLDGRRILVVDDNAATRRVIRTVFETAGGVVDEADGALPALQRLVHATEADPRYDVIVLDSLMPEVDGFAVAESVAEMSVDRRPPILMLTSAAMADDAKRARTLGVRGFLEKPISKHRLLQAVSLVLTPGRSDGQERRMVTRGTLERMPRAARILLADDSKVNQAVAVSILEKRGHSVDVVDNGRLAVAAALAERYDIVLMDLEMPEMDGVDAAKAIRDHRSPEDLPIVAMTAHAFADEQQRCRAAGMNEFIAKPFRADTLYELIDRLTMNASPRSRGEGPRRQPDADS